MRVTVNYGIDFDKIPDLLQGMLDECKDTNEKIDALISVLSYALHADEEGLLQKACHDLLVALSKIDAKLGDFSEMSTGFMSAKKELKAKEERDRVAQAKAKEEAQSKVKTFEHLKAKDPEEGDTDES